MYHSFTGQTKKKGGAREMKENKPPASFQRSTSLVTRISIVYLALTILNLILFWVASGANQMRLISEKAVLATDSVAYELVRRLQPFTANSTWALALQAPNPAVKSGAQAALLESLRVLKDSDKIIVPEAHVYTAENESVFDFPAKKNRDKQNESDLGKKILKAFQLRELKNQSFYGAPDTETYSVEIFIPIVVKGARELVLTAAIPMDSLKAELKSLYKLGVTMALVLAAMQALFGLWLYRTLVRPLKNLASATDRVAASDFALQIPEDRPADELGQLIFGFNRMSAALREKTEKLESAIKDLEAQHRVIQMELDLAQNIQHGIIPAANTSDRIAVSAYYGPLEKVSGDYYDIFNLPEGAVGLLITDASGHGVPAALVTIMAKMHFSSLAQKILKPDQLMARVNAELSYAIATSDYLTAFYLIIRSDRSVEYCNAGHHKALVRRKATGQIEELDTEGFFIGVLADLPGPYGMGRIQLEAGDRIILYTDGIVEGTNSSQQQYGYERFLSRIAEWGTYSTETLKDKLMADINEWAGGEARKDDYTLFIAELK